MSSYVNKTSSGCESTSCSKSSIGDNVVTQKLKLAEHGFVHKRADCIKLTKKAIEKIREKIFIRRRKNNCDGLKISIPSKGCGGLTYNIEYAEYGLNVTEIDQVTVIEDISLFTDPRASLILFDTEIDFFEDIDKSGFRFNNPNSGGSCGCGDSFHLKDQDS